MSTPHLRFSSLDGSTTAVVSFPASYAYPMASARNATGRASMATGVDSTVLPVLLDAVADNAPDEFSRHLRTSALRRLGAGFSIEQARAAIAAHDGLVLMDEAGA